MSSNDIPPLPPEMQELFDDIVNELAKQMKEEEEENKQLDEPIIQMSPRRALRMVLDGDPRLSYDWDRESGKEILQEFISAQKILENLVSAYEKNPSIADIYSNKPVD